MNKDEFWTVDRLLPRVNSAFSDAKPSGGIPLSQCKDMPKEKIFGAYVPRIAGKEKRKQKASKAGLLGVEGVGREAIMKALGPYISSSAPKRNPIRPAVLFELGLMGGEESQSKRDALLRTSILHVTARMNIW